MVALNTDTKETYPREVQEILKSAVAEVLKRFDKPISIMKKRDRLQVVALLDEAGIFAIKNSHYYVASLFGTSRYTIYNYFSELRQPRLREAKPRVRERDMAIAVLFLHTGLRVSELTNLKLVNVDLDRGQVKITRKGNKEQYLHLNGETVSALAEYLANRPQAQNGRFFVGTSGRNLERRYVYGLVRRYLKSAGIDKGKRGPHISRHTFCTRLHQKGVGPFTIKDLAGHKSLNTTMRYIKIENKEQAEAIDRLEFGIL